jgi:hypothetical protein
MVIPTPEPGLVISYGYLWHYEQQSGLEEGRKHRPCVIVLAVERRENAIIVTVLPITHRAPANPAAAVAIPAVLKRHLGLDADHSWVVVTEGNEFVWPGYDLHRIPGTNRFDYGFLPPRFFKRIIEVFTAWRRTQRRLVVSRD